MNTFPADDFGMLFDATRATTVGVLPSGQRELSGARPLGEIEALERASVPADRQKSHRRKVERSAQSPDASRRWAELSRRSRAFERPSDARSRHQRRGTPQARLPSACRPSASQRDPRCRAHPFELLGSRAPFSRSVLRHGHTSYRSGSHCPPSRSGDCSRLRLRVVAEPAGAHMDRRARRSALTRNAAIADTDPRLGPRRQGSRTRALPCEQSRRRRGHSVRAQAFRCDRIR